MSCKIFNIWQYECIWATGNAVVAAESPEQALSLLEEHLKDDPGIVLESREGNIRLCVRGDGGIMDSGMRAEKPGVLFPFYEERFPTYKVFTDVF